MVKAVDMCLLESIYNPNWTTFGCSKIHSLPRTHKMSSERVSNCITTTIWILIGLKQVFGVNDVRIGVCAHTCRATCITSNEQETCLQLR